MSKKMAFFSSFLVQLKIVKKSIRNTKIVFPLTRIVQIEIIKTYLFKQITSLEKKYPVFQF